MPVSVHDLLVAALQAKIAGGPAQGPAAQDAWTSGTEEAILLLDGGIELHLLFVAPHPLFWIERAARRRPAGDSGFGDWLQRRIQGTRITAIDAGASGRVLRIMCGQISLVLDPGAQACRLLVLNEDNVVEQRFPPAVHAQATGRAAPGEHYREPGGAYVEVWRRSEKSGPAVTTAGATAAVRLLVCANEPRAEDELPSIFLSPIACTATDARTLDGPAKPLDAAHRAGQLWIRRARALEAARVLTQRIRAERSHLEKLAARIAAEADEARDGTLLRRQAEALLANAGRVRRGAAEIDLDDPSSPGTKIHVRLDPTLGLGENAARLFQRARRLSRAAPLRQRKRDEAERLRAFLGSRKVDLPPADVAWSAISGTEMLPVQVVQRLSQMTPPTEPGLKRRWSAFMAACKEALGLLDAPLARAGHLARRSTAESRTAPSRSAAARQAPAARHAIAPGFHPRRFDLPGGWTVLVARSSRENDLLTHRVAAPADLWFHAQGVTGSHVILRRGRRRDNPARAVIEAAAAIAAYYSKARTSGMAPVIYTERRYVRKPRRAPAGLAMCTREKTIMVEPRLPVAESEGGEPQE